MKKIEYVKSERMNKILAEKRKATIKLRIKYALFGVVIASVAFLGTNAVIDRLGADKAYEKANNCVWREPATFAEWQMDNGGRVCIKGEGK